MISAAHDQAGNVNALHVSQTRTGKILGISFLIAIAIVVVANYAISFRFVVPGDAMQTAKNIHANETMYRVNLVCNLLYLFTTIVMLSALYVLFKSHSVLLSMIIIFSKFVYAIMWTVTSLNSLNSLKLMNTNPTNHAFTEGQLYSLVSLNSAGSWDAYYIGLPFWGIAAMIFSYLFLKSGYIPKVLAVFGILASLWCIFCSCAYLIFPEFDKTIDLSLFDIPLVLFEIITGFLLLFKGINFSYANSKFIKQI